MHENMYRVNNKSLSIIPAYLSIRYTRQFADNSWGYASGLFKDIFGHHGKPYVLADVIWKLNPEVWWKGDANRMLYTEKYQDDYFRIGEVPIIVPEILQNVASEHTQIVIIGA